MRFGDVGKDVVCVVVGDLWKKVSEEVGVCRVSRGVIDETVVSSSSEIECRPSRKTHFPQIPHVSVKPLLNFKFKIFSPYHHHQESVG